MAVKLSIQSNIKFELTVASIPEQVRQPSVLSK